MSIVTLNAQKAKTKIKTTATEYSLNSTSTTLNWTGTKVGGKHTGTILAKEGTFVQLGNSISSGKVTIDMNSITCNDIADAEYNGKLIGHLKADDFFGTEKFSTATLEIVKTKLIKGSNYKVDGKMTIKGITKPISFNSTIDFKDGTLKANAKITINRTKFGIKYGSGLIGTAQDKLIYDDFILDVVLEATKK